MLFTHFFLHLKKFYLRVDDQKIKKINKKLVFFS